MVWNLLSDAVKFTPKPGSVDVLLQRVNPHVEIDQQDLALDATSRARPHDHPSPE